MSAPSEKQLLSGHLHSILAENRALQTVLERVPALNLPNYYVGAGFVTQTVWNVLSGRPPTQDVKDIDLVYFDDSDLSDESELHHGSRARQLLSDIPFDIDVTNEARVHLWYESRFGKEISPYKSTEDAIDTWPTTATAIGVRREGENQIVYAPFGIEDLLGFVLRPNKVQITEDIYHRKVARWSRCWPELCVVPWEDEPDHSRR